MQAPSSPSRSRHSKNTPPHQRGSSQRHPPQHNTQPNSNRLYLRVSRKFLRRLPESTGTQQFPPPLPPLPNASGNLYVFDADLSEISSYAGNTVNWLIKIARLIFEPLGTSFLYTFRTGSVDYWWAREAEASRWERVHQGEQLKATIYEFRPNNNAHITLTQISLRQMRSVTTNTSEDRASVFRNALTLRDQTCVISHTPIHTIASHLIPRRLGDAGVRHVMTRFAGSASAQLDRYDPTIGILLYGPLDQFTDTYKLGYWNVGPNQYAVHLFDEVPVTINGVPTAFSSDPPLHGTHITLTAHDPTVQLPHPAVFDWHYLQCVISKFGTTAYKNFENVKYFVFPFCTIDDEDEGTFDSDDSQSKMLANPPYPTYHWDRFLADEYECAEGEERRNNIAIWRSDVVTNCA